MTKKKKKAISREKEVVDTGEQKQKDKRTKHGPGSSRDTRSSFIKKRDAHFYSAAWLFKDVLHCQYLDFYRLYQDCKLNVYTTLKSTHKTVVIKQAQTVRGETLLRCNLLNLLITSKVTAGFCTPPSHLCLLPSLSLWVA